MLANRLDEIGRRHRRVTLTLLALRSLLVAWFATALTYAAVTLGWQRPPLWACAGVFLAVGAAVFAVGYRPPLDRLALARLADRRLQLMDRLATAVEWNERPSPLLPWLMEDADQQARFVDAASVVPWPRPSPTRTAVLVASMAAAALLWSAPLPSGLLVRSAPAADAPAAADDTGELLREIAALRDLVSQIPTPEARRLDRDLAQLHAGLRDRSIPKDEAVALLRHFQRRAETALASRALGENSPADPGLDRIQEIAERLTVISRESAGQASPAEPGAQPVAAGRQLSESEVPPEFLELLRHIGEQGGTGGEPVQARSLPEGESGPPSSQPAENSSTTPSQPDQPPGQRGSMPTEESEVSDTRRGRQEGESLQASGSGLPGQGSGTAESGEEPGDLASPYGTSETGTGAGQSGSFEGIGGLRILEHLPGQLLEGPIHTGQVNSSLGGDTGSSTSVAPAVSPTSGQAESGQAVTREGVPLAYREAVRKYFQSLEPAADP